MAAATAVMAYITALGISIAMAARDFQSKDVVNGALAIGVVLAAVVAMSQVMVKLGKGGKTMMKQF